MMVIMALVTTAMTSPLLDLLVEKTAPEEIDSVIPSPASGT